MSGQVCFVKCARLDSVRKKFCVNVCVCKIVLLACYIFGDMFTNLKACSITKSEYVGCCRFSLEPDKCKGIWFFTCRASLARRLFSVCHVILLNESLENARINVEYCINPTVQSENNSVFLLSSKGCNIATHNL